MLGNIDDFVHHIRTQRSEQRTSGVMIAAGVPAIQGVAYVLVVGRALWAVFYRTSFREPWTEGGERQLSAELASREIIAKLPHAGGWPA